VSDLLGLIGRTRSLGTSAVFRQEEALPGEKASEFCENRKERRKVLRLARGGNQGGERLIDLRRRTLQTLLTCEIG
jgi:hypothetical protein